MVTSFFKKPKKCEKFESDDGACQLLPITIIEQICVIIIQIDKINISPHFLNRLENIIIKKISIIESTH